MWSIGLIVGVAAVASLVLMAVGITMAIIFERQRHRKYIERHFAGTIVSFNSNAPRIIESCSTPTRRYSRRSNTEMKRGSVAWVPLSSTETVNQTRHAGLWSPGLEPTLATKKVLRKTLRGTIKKRSSKSRQLRRTVRLVNIPNSPLSVITEKSDSSRSSPPAGASPMIVAPQPTPEPHGNSADIQWQSPVSKMRKLAAYNSLARTNSTGHSITASRPNYAARSISMSSSMSSAPGEPLPPLPSGGPLQPAKSELKHHTSNLSIDSIGSSVLEASSIMSSPPRPLIGKPTSQALQDFDFGLDTVTKLRSPPDLLRRSPSESSATTVVLLKANANTLSDLYQTVSIPRVRFKEHHGSLAKQIGTSDPGFTGLRPVSEDPEVFDSRPTMLGTIPGDENNDPFFTSASARPVSTENRIPLEELVNQTCFQRSSVGSGESVKGHKRQNCIKISNLPLMPSTPSLSKHTHAVEPKKKIQALTDVATLNTKRASEDINIENRHDLSFPDPDSELCQNGSDTNCLQTNANDITTSVSATPVSHNTICWNFDFTLPNTPKFHISPSPLRTHDSPILPSPAYTSANLYPQQRPSLVRGPRNPRTSRSRSQSPLKNKPRLVDLDTCSNTNAGHGFMNKRRMGSTDLRKSVQLLRSMNSEAQLLSAEQGYMYHRLSSTNNSLRLVGDTKESRDLLTVPETGNLSQNSLTMVPLPSPLAVPKVGTRKPSPLLSQSSESASRTSIWEDISVRDDSPEPDLPLSISMDEDGKPLRNSALPAVAHDPLARFYGQAGQEKAVYTEQKQLPAWHTIAETGDTLKHQDEDLLVPDTPRSIYDENGFLKE